MRATFNEGRGTERNPNAWTVEISTEARQVYMHTDANDSGPGRSADMPPSQARELAAALLRAADEAEGRTSSTPERDLLTFIDRAGWDGTDMVAAVRAQVARETRDEVARDLEQMDGTNLGMSLVRTQAVRVARSGLEPMDVRRGE